jgi:hypothetical protein
MDAARGPDYADTQAPLTPQRRIGLTDEVAAPWCS